MSTVENEIDFIQKYKEGHDAVGNKIFKTIIERKIDIFANTFARDSKSIFKNDTKLIHPLEYGMYREKCFKELLELIVNKQAAVADGFIITALEDISTQCDIIIYQSNVIPLIDNNIAKFFPIEIVNGIGEIKSDLSKRDFKDALQKLARNKMLTEKRKGSVATSKGTFGEYDYLITFLVCNKLSFDITSIDYNEIYEQIPRAYWHNAILSLEDGLLTYNLNFKELPKPMKDNFIAKRGNIEAKPVIWEYPVHIENREVYNCSPKLIKSDENNIYSHVIDFLTILKAGLDVQKQFNFDFVEYLDLGGEGIFL